MKCARTANHNGLVNSKTADIEEDTPNDIAIFNNPIVPAVCNKPIVTTNIKHL